MKRKEQYKFNKAAKVGDEIVCPICGKHFIKKQWQQAFDDGKCKDAYWNAKKDRHKGGITNDAKGYHHQYNMAHPERLERIGIYKENGKFGRYDEDGEFWSFEEEADMAAMCEDPTIGF